MLICMLHIKNVSSIHCITLEIYASLESKEVSGEVTRSVNEVWSRFNNTSSDNNTISSATSHKVYTLGEFNSSTEDGQLASACKGLFLAPVTTRFEKCIFVSLF